MPRIPPDPTPPTELAVVGELKDHPEELLLVSPDGTYYAYNVPDDDTHPVDPDDSWEVEDESPEDLFT